MQIYRGEDKAEAPVMQAPIIGKGRPSMMVHGDILSARPGFELPERLPGHKPPKGSNEGKPLRKWTNSSKTITYFFFRKQNQDHFQ